jgi:hypothetical protein
VIIVGSLLFRLKPVIKRDYFFDRWSNLIEFECRLKPIFS